MSGNIKCPICGVDLWSPVLAKADALEAENSALRSTLAERDAEIESMRATIHNLGCLVEIGKFEKVMQSKPSSLAEAVRRVHGKVVISNDVEHLRISYGTIIGDDEDDPE